MFRQTVVVKLLTHFSCQLFVLGGYISNCIHLIHHLYLHERSLYISCTKKGDLSHLSKCICMDICYRACAKEGDGVGFGWNTYTFTSWWVMHVLFAIHVVTLPAEILLFNLWLLAYFNVFWIDQGFLHCRQQRKICCSWQCQTLILSRKQHLPLYGQGLP